MRILKTKVSFIATRFWKLLTPINMVTWMPESSRFRTPFGNQRFYGSQTMRNSAWPYFYPNFQLIQHKLSEEMSLLVRYDILGLFGNTFTADHMNSPHNRDRLLQKVETPLSPKPKIFAEIFFAFPTSTWNLARFKKKMSFIAQIVVWNRVIQDPF